MRKTVLFFFIISICVLSAIEVSDLEKAQQKLLNSKKELFKRTEQFIYSNPNSPDLPFLYFRLAELSSEIHSFDNPYKTAKYYHKVIELDPNFSDRDAALYNFAFYSFEAAKKYRYEARLRNVNLIANWPDSLRLSEYTPKVKDAIKAYSEIFEEMLYSPFHSEASYRLGSIYYDLAFDARKGEKYFKKSGVYFNYLANKEEDPLQQFGLFYRGWVNFSKGSYQNAIDDFSKILRITVTEKKSRLYFEDDAIENIAFSLIELDSTNFEQVSVAAEAARASFLTLVEESYGKEILRQAIKLKLRYNAPMQAIDLYNAYISLYPLSLENPSLVDSITKVYAAYPNRTREGDPTELIIAENTRIIDTYTTSSDWYTANTENNGLPTQLQVIRNAYKLVTPLVWNKFVESNETTDFARYQQLNTEFARFTAFMQDQEGGEWQANHQRNVVDGSLSLAESSQEPSQYYIALNNIRQLNADYPDNQSYVENETNAFYCIEKTYQLLDYVLTDTTGTQIYSDTLNAITMDKAFLDSLYIAGTVRYESILQSDGYTERNKNSKLIEIVFKRSEIRFNNSEFDSAFVDYEKLLTFKPEAAIKKISYFNMATIMEQRGDFVRAESLYNMALENAEGEEKETIKTNILATIQSNADNLQNSDNYQAAAEEFLRLAKEFENSDAERSISFKSKAIEMLAKIPEYQRCLDLWLEIAAVKTDIQDVLSFYATAWNIADTLLMDYAQGESLRYQFIERFPASNEAYHRHIEIIKKYDGEPFNDKLKAADMYMALHDMADNLDLGGDSKENLFLLALNIHKDLGNEAKTIEMMIAFEKLYPAHASANTFLTLVAKHYKDQGEEGKLKDIAKYMLRKDPTLNILEEIAREELRILYVAADSMFNAQQFDSMRIKVAEYKALEDKYTSEEGLNLRIDSIYEQFAYFENYVKFNEKYEETIAGVEKKFLKASPNRLLLVGKPSKWKTKIAPRVNKMGPKADKQAERLLALIKEGADFEITQEQQTKVLYFAAQVYERALEVTTNQIKKYLDITDEANNFKNAGPAVYKKLTGAIASQTKEKRVYLRNKSLAYYNSILENFYDKNGYENEYTQIALDKMIEAGIRKPKVYVDSWISQSWLANTIDFGGDYIAYKDSSAYWADIFVADTITVAEASMPLTMANEFNSTYFKTALDAEIKPELVLIQYVASSHAEIFVNDSLITAKESVIDSVDYNGKKLFVYSLRTGKFFEQGLNRVVFNRPAGSGEFTAKLSLQFDQEKLDYFRTTAELNFLTDYSWYCIKQDSIPTDIQDVDSTWTLCGKSYFSFYKVNMFGMKETDAVGIWYPEFDSTATETVYFLGKLPINTEFIESQFKIIGQENLSMWINGNMIFEDSPIIIDNLANQVLPYEMYPDPSFFIQGDNIVLIKIVSGKQYKGVIMDMNYKVKKD